ncbi:hypothetical protein [Bacteriovorax sp. DB6_IX]|uniref:hypothetical protein n=1 Tax=Bacteriovorax sp. DB6_IX TaxID=1353530 RepID=UPI00038A0D63|nr:hypothetical protein [Bacteriovorax sp. DB6_IX]EQC51945.1 hypothetical protein M901_1395 [Bacteriovorax sp. DB6_IX]
MIRKSLFATFILVNLSLNSLASDFEFSKEVPPLTAALLKENFLSKKITKTQIGTFNKLIAKNHGEILFLDEEIVKATLNHSKSLKKGYKVIDHKMYELLTQKVKTLPENMPFSKLIYKSLLQDLSELLTEPELKQFGAFQKKKLNKIDNKTRMFSRKVALLTPWIRLALSKESEILNDTLNEYSYEMYQRLVKILELTSRAYPKNLSDKKVFVQIKDQGLEKARKELKDLTFEVAPDPSPAYQAPSQLPQPVDDWVPVDETIIEDGVPLTKDELFPEPDPDYEAPKVLPKPVDNWE